MRSFLANVPLFLPGVGLSVLLAWVMAQKAARRLETWTAVAFLGIVSLGIVVSATMTPGTEAILGGVSSNGGCDMSRVGLIPISMLLGVNDASLNVLLFVPLGVVLGITPWSRGTIVLVAAALLLPFIIEFAQGQLPALGRTCETADVADNLTGFVLGLMAGGLVKLSRTHGRTPA